jgi:hypothetical protein
MEGMTVSSSKKRLWVGYILTVLPTLFLLMDGGMKLFKPPVVVEATLNLGYPQSAIVGIGLTLLACTVLYLMPRTSRRQITEMVCEEGWSYIAECGAEEHCSSRRCEHGIAQWRNDAQGNGHRQSK